MWTSLGERVKLAHHYWSITYFWYFQTSCPQRLSADSAEQNAVKFSRVTDNSHWVFLLFFSSVEQRISITIHYESWLYCGCVQPVFLKLAASISTRPLSSARLWLRIPTGFGAWWLVSLRAGLDIVVKRKLCADPHDRAI